MIDLVVDKSKEDELTCKSYKLYREFKNCLRQRLVAKVKVVNLLQFVQSGNSRWQRKQLI